MTGVAGAWRENRFELDGAFTVEQVSAVRRLLERLHRTGANHEMLSRVSIAAHELFENAVKFSSDGFASIRVDVVAPHRVLIMTRNRASEEHLVALRAMAARLQQGSRDMMGVYLDLMQQAPRARGGLGIGRVAAEAEMAVDIELDGDLVVVRAVMALEGEAA